MAEPADTNEGGDRGEAVLAIFQRGAEFTHELLEENARLRRTIEESRTRSRDAALSDPEWEKLRTELLSKIDELENQNDSIREEVLCAREATEAFEQRHAQVEEENNCLANLYVASYQLHATLDAVEVVKTIQEIVINLVGAETFAVYVREDGSDVLGAVASEGDAVSAFPEVRIGEGFVGESVANGEVCIADPGGRGPRPSEGGSPIVSIPLCIEERAVGVIVIYELLEQKSGFTDLDHELFRLLAGHASTSLFAARLCARPGRDLGTVQGFLDLLTR